MSGHAVGRRDLDEEVGRALLAVQALCVARGVALHAFVVAGPITAEFCTPDYARCGIRGPSVVPRAGAIRGAATGVLGGRQCVQEEEEL